MEAQGRGDDAHTLRRPPAGEERRVLIDSIRSQARLALLPLLLCAGCGKPEAQEPDGAPASAAVDSAPRVETAVWTNERSRLTGEKLAHFVPFTFRYPASWRLVEDGSGDTPNFVKVEHATESGITIENFAVGWYAGAGADQLSAALEPQFAVSFPDYTHIEDETALIDGVASRGFRFQAVVQSPEGPVTFWGRVLARPVEPTSGIVLVMFASQLAPGIEGARDLGRKGELPVILESFRVGEP